MGHYGKIVYTELVEEEVVNIALQNHVT